MAVVDYRTHGFPPLFLRTGFAAAPPSVHCLYPL
jgi:hypothetical protein